MRRVGCSRLISIRRRQADCEGKGFPVRNLKNHGVCGRAPNISRRKEGEGSMGTDDVKILTLDEIRTAVTSASTALEPVIDHLGAYGGEMVPLTTEDAKKYEDTLRHIDSLLSDVVFSLCMPRK